LRWTRDAHLFRPNWLVASLQEPEASSGFGSPLKCLADQKKIAKASRKAKKVSHGIEREDGERPTKKSRHNGA
tara:strand:- start:244 stop:462 length:219 start_codon:yes stop_codon:yes gene_type:complete